MDNAILSKEKFPELINLITTKNKLYAPVKENGFSLFKQVKDATEIDTSYVNTRVPPKSIIFKQTETLFRFTPGKKGSVEAIPEEKEKIVIFAIKTCDAKAFALLDPVFLGDFKDPYYSAKRKNSVLIGLSCNNPGPACFCTSFDDSPASKEYVDILFTDIGDNYYIEGNTEIGKKFLEEHKTLFDSASSENQKSRDKVEREAIGKIKRTMKLTGIAEKLDGMFEHSIWYESARKCIGCGTCTYLCPTCHCFDMQDESTLNKGARIRVWDSCMYPEYTHHASGHNPRPARMNRVRNRVYHKFNYFPKNTEVFGCTGCGRCIEYCSVNIDIIEIINKIGEMEE